MQGACCKSPCRIASPSGTFRQLLALDELCLFLCSLTKHKIPSFQTPVGAPQGLTTLLSLSRSFTFPNHTTPLFKPFASPNLTHCWCSFLTQAIAPPNFKIIYTCRHCPLLPVVTTEEVHLLPSPTSENWRSPSLCHQVLTYSSLHICDTTPTPLIFLRPC